MAKIHAPRQQKAIEEQTVPQLKVPEGLMSQEQSANAPEQPAKGKRVVQQELFESEQAAISAAEARNKGARRAFKVTIGGKTYFTVSHNEHRARGAAAAAFGAFCEELGKTARATRPMGMAAILAAINSLPENERAGVLAQIRDNNGEQK